MFPVTVLQCQDFPDFADFALDGAIHNSTMHIALMHRTGGMNVAVSKDLVAASAAPMILSILAEGDSYGYAIIKRVRELSGGQMAWTDGMLYPVLHRLERQGLVESYAQTSEAGRKRKYYQLKKQGTKALAEQKDQWMLVHNALQQLWERKPCLS